MSWGKDGHWILPGMKGKEKEASPFFSIKRGKDRLKAHQGCPLGSTQGEGEKSSEIVL